MKNQQLIVAIPNALLSRRILLKDDSRLKKVENKQFSLGNDFALKFNQIERFNASPQVFIDFRFSRKVRRPIMKVSKYFSVSRR